MTCIALLCVGVCGRVCAILSVSSSKTIPSLTYFVKTATLLVIRNGYSKRNIISVISIVTIYHCCIIHFISAKIYYFAVIMLTPNGIYVIFIVFMVMCCVSQSFRLQTEENLTAVRGGIISVPCKVSVPVHAVYWYKHNFTGAPDDGASLVARDFFGFTDPLHGFERFSITKDYSLIVGNVTVHDETTYSCLVVEIGSERGYTDLRVVAVAEPLEPIVKSCNVTAQGRCIYTVDENSPEDVTLVCMVHNVRPPPDLTWIRNDGRIPENATHQTQEKDGLFNVSSQIQVSKSNFYHHYTCQAKGEAVNGISSMMITIIMIIEDDVTVSHDHGIAGGLITSIFFNAFLLLIIIMSVSCLIYKKCGYPKSSKERTAGKLPKPEQLNIIESKLFIEQEGNELGMITLWIQYHDSGPMKQSCLKVNQHMQLEELKGKLCEKFRIHQSLIHITYNGQDLSRGGREDLTTVGLDHLSVLDVSKISERSLSAALHHPIWQQY